MGNKSRSGYKRRHQTANKVATINPTSGEPAVFSPTIIKPPDKPNNHELVQYRQERHIEAFYGPIPPPDLLKAYNEIDPEFGNRIITMAEKQQDHRINLETQVIKGDIHRANLGLWFAPFIACAGIGCGTYILVIGREASGLALIFVPLATLVGIFITYQRKRAQSLKEQSKNPSEPNNDKP